MADKAHEKMSGIASCQGNASENHKIPLTTGMASLKKIDNTTCWGGCGETACGNTVWQNFTRLNIEVPDNQAIPHRGMVFFFFKILFI